MLELRLKQESLKHKDVLIVECSAEGARDAGDVTICIPKHLGGGQN